MSKASEWAKEVKRLMRPSFSPAGWIKAHGKNAATIAKVTDSGHLELSSCTPLEPGDALELGEWLVDAFEERQGVGLPLTALRNFCEQHKNCDHVTTLIDGGGLLCMDCDAAYHLPEEA